MERGIRQDIIYAVVIAVLLHGVVILLPFPGGWRGHSPVEDRQGVLTVSLCAPLTVISRPLPSHAVGIAGSRIFSQHMDRREETRHPGTGAGGAVQVAVISAVEGNFIAGQHGDRPAPAAAREEEPGASGMLYDTDFIPPHYLHNPVPSYPFLARRSGLEGVTVLSVEIRVDGKVAAVKVKRSSGYDVLDEAALIAVEKWVFEPALKRGIPVECPVDVPIRFALEKS
ncbi:MAG: energy transducer TonB [Deltaproteobacteria bacterium]|nr:energy transducer TonB [Deltaproteobacteria bacterium]